MLTRPEAMHTIHVILLELHLSQMTKILFEALHSTGRRSSALDVRTVRSRLRVILPPSERPY